MLILVLSVTLSISIWIKSLILHVLHHSLSHILCHRVHLLRLSVIVLLLLVLVLLLHCVLHVNHHRVHLLLRLATNLHILQLLLHIADHSVHDWIVGCLGLCFELSHILNLSLWNKTNLFIMEANLIRYFLKNLLCKITSFC